MTQPTGDEEVPETTWLYQLIVEHICTDPSLLGISIVALEVQKREATARKEGYNQGWVEKDTFTNEGYKEGRIAGIREMAKAVKERKLAYPEGIVSWPPVIVIGDIFGKDIDHLATDLLGEEYPFDGSIPYTPENRRMNE